MTTIEWKDDFIEGYIAKGREEGREAGREEGVVSAKAQAVLKILEARGLNPTEQQRSLVRGSTDLAELDRWFDRALAAASAADVFQD